MGNVISAILMYALEAAWVFQRFIDQDYTQNHGSRLIPIADKSDEEGPEVFLPNGSSTPILSRSPHHCSKPVRLSRGHKKTYSEPISMPLQRLPRERIRKRSSSYRPRRRRTPPTPPADPPTPPCPTDTTEWVSRLVETCPPERPTRLRRAYSDINIAPRPVVTPQRSDLSDSSMSPGEESVLKLVVRQRRSPNNQQDFRIYSVV